MVLDAFGVVRFTHEKIYLNLIDWGQTRIIEIVSKTHTLSILAYVDSVSCQIHKLYWC